MIRIGIDIGGTFTDLCVSSHAGPCWFGKVVTTPADLAFGFMQVLGRASEAKCDHRRIRQIMHATTVATNAILEPNTGRMGMITTAGFRDVVEIGRHCRRDICALFWKHRRR